MPQPGEKYHHYKDSNKVYEIVGIAFHTETEEDMVVYKPRYSCEHTLFVRPLKMFMETVEKDGKSLPRFTKIS